MKLVIVHHHFRPGGVRRVIESAVPHLLKVLRPRVDEVVLAGGELPDAPWRDRFRQQTGRVPVREFIEPAFGYVAEQQAPASVVAGQCRRALRRLLTPTADAAVLVWAHNLSLGRNLLLARELTRCCAAGRIPLVAHHHDWWFENRWRRWPEMRRCGFRSLPMVASTVFPVSPFVRHVAINQADAKRLRRHFGGQSGWMPNLVEREAPRAAGRVARARAWLDRQLGGRAPVWLLPCRLLRRKNLAEALLLTRWLRPEAWLVTTGRVSSADEQPYARCLEEAAQDRGWRLRLSLLAGDEAAKPSVSELCAAAECLLLTSIQEGFGLPYVEAAAAGRPLVARDLVNMGPDLARFGFRFPQLYRELRIPSGLFDCAAERQRQADRFCSWQARLPRNVRCWAVEPELLRSDRPARLVAFSRLTLAAQLEVLSRPAEESWRQCAPWNPFLVEWRRRAAAGGLRRTPWPRGASAWLGGAAYARRFLAILESRGRARLSAVASALAQADFIRWKLGVEYQYPLLWGPEP